VNEFSTVSHSIISGLTMPSCSHKCGLATKIIMNLIMNHRVVQFPKCFVACRPSILIFLCFYVIILCLLLSICLCYSALGLPFLNKLS